MKRQILNCKTLVTAKVALVLTFSSIPLLGSAAHAKTVNIPAKLSIQQKANLA